MTPQFASMGEPNPMECSNIMGTAHRNLVSITASVLVVLLAGCASSGPSVSQAPPETPEEKPASAGATAAVRGERSEDDKGGNQPGAGAGGAAEGSPASSGGEGAERARETGEGHASDGSSGESAATAVGQGSDNQPPAGSPVTGSEATAVLERKLGDSLDKFDRHMRQEMDHLAQETTEAERAGSQATGGETGHESRANAEATGEASSGGTAGEDTASEGDSGGSVGGSGPGPSGSDRVPPDVGDGSDDDIVARQLREAALAEEDPELREKLWDEYRRYKASLGDSSRDKK